MKLTVPLRHAKYFWWGKGWGQKPRKNTDHFYWKNQWEAKKRRPLEVIKQTLPAGANPVDLNSYLEEDFQKELYYVTNFVLPWPYSKRPIKGTLNDPKYKEKTALIYQRNKRIVDPINLPLFFTNSILENDLPENIQKFRNNIKIDDKFVGYCKRRIEWALFNDAALRKLPINREFPYLDQKPPRVWGTTINRKENNLLQILYDISNSWHLRTFGLNPNVILQRFSYPNCVYPIDREEKFILLNLECDFVTLLSPSSNELHLKQCNFDPNFESNAADKPLTSIFPISWEVGFDSKNFYNDDFDFKIPHNSQIQMIFLSNNSVRLLNEEDYQGRGVMFCYGYAMQQAKIMKPDSLKLPITIQCIYTVPKDFKIGFVLFQLNTLNFDANIRNQVWFSQPRSITEETKEVILDCLTMNSFQISQM